MPKYGFDAWGNYRGPNGQFTKEFMALPEEDKVLLKKLGKRYKEIMEDKMKDLKRGDFVWSKMYGNGLVYGRDYRPYQILFEGKVDLMLCVRSDLFAKGDEVEAIEWTGTGDNPKGIFIGTTDNYGMCRLIIKTDCNCEYASDIKHKVIDKLEVILTMNGKEIDAKAISKETWDNLRRME